MGETTALRPPGLARLSATDAASLLEQRLRAVGQSETHLKEDVGDILAFHPDPGSVWSKLEPGERAELERRTQRRLAVREPE